MKAILLSFACLVFFTFNKTYAQPCSINNLQIDKVYSGADGKKFADVSFDMDRNNGNKFIYLHFWTTENFKKINKEKFKNGAGPKGADINGVGSNSFPALATVAIDNNNYLAPAWSSLKYRPDASVPVVKGKKMEVIDAPVNGSSSQPMYRLSVKEIPLDYQQALSADDLDVAIWTTQSDAINSHIHCSALGRVAPQFPLSFRGSANCATGKYTINVSNPSDKTISGRTDIYADNGNRPNDGTFDPATDTRIDEITYFVIEPHQTIAITRSIPSQYFGYNLYSQMKLSNSATQVQRLNTSACGTLPIKLLSFTAIRQKQQVAVKWQTASEQDALGFNVMRLTNEGDWKVVAYVPSQSAGSLSTQTLSYQYTDLNPTKGTSQYRLQEVTTNGKKGMSEVRTVIGEEQTAKITLYPNPSTNGKISIVLNNTSAKDIIITDLSGRTVKQLSNITSTNVFIDQLKNGFYSVQVIDRTTQEIKTEKLIVKM